MRDVRNPSVANVLFAMDMVVHAYEAEVTTHNASGDQVPDWKFKFDFIFNNLWPKMLKPRLDDAGLTLEWWNPDSSYEDDVKAFVEAVQILKEKLEIVAK